MNRLPGTWPKDLLASVVVFLVALPLCMGIAIASGVPPQMGLITGVVGGIVVGFLGGCPLQVSGPAAGLAVIVFEFVHRHGVEMLAPVLLLAGLIQLAAGLSKVGQWFRAISPSVIHGMMAGIGILIFGSQFHVMVDDQPAASGIENLLSIPTAIYKGIFPMDGSAHHLAAALGIATIAILVLWQKFRPHQLRFLPGALLAVVATSAAAAYLALPVQRVGLPENFLEGIDFISLQSIQGVFAEGLWTTALMLAFIASAETLLSAAAVDKMQSGPRTDYDRELAAQGAGNTLCGLLGGLPMTGVIVRSGANVQAGAKTRLSTVLHGIWLLTAVMAFPDLLRMIPTASLGAILVYTGYRLVDVRHLRELARFGRGEVGIYLATVIGIVAGDLLKGVLLGLVLALLKLLYTFSHLDVEYRKDEKHRGRGYLHLNGAATFIKLPRLASALERIPASDEVHLITANLNYIDHASIEMLANWSKIRKELGGQLVVEWADLEDRATGRSNGENGQEASGAAAVASSHNGRTEAPRTRAGGAA